MNQANHPENLEAMRHTAAHVLAAASQKLRPETRLGVGPPIEDGFYHDIDVDQHYSESDLATLQAKMEEIQKMDLPITQREASKDEARALFAHDPFKLELIDELPGDTVGISDMGNGFFLTLCKGGHAASTGKIGSFKLTRLAGVYWKGNENSAQLQRVYGVLFPTQKELDEHLQLLEEAKKRDHRKLGQQLDLFTFSPLVGAGLPLFTPKGTIIRDELSDFLWEIQGQRGYQKVDIPHLAKPELYKTSGHWDKFTDSLFHVRGKGGEEFVVKPMNCPHHTQIYASRPRSYKDLPIRFAEITKVYRDEQAGELLGLARVRSITQDDAHVFCRMDQMRQEIQTVMEIIQTFYAAFSFELRVRLSLSDPAKPEAYLGTREIWEEAEGSLRAALKEQGAEFSEVQGEAAFYGPKIDFTAIDSLKRSWQLATVQLDLNMPTRFGLTYTAQDGREETPVMIHRAITGAQERFIAILLEHYNGALPLWLSPVQVAVLPISDEQNEYAKEIVIKLREADIRVEIDDRSESIGKKIREAQIQKVPYMLIVGKKEVEASVVAVRSREKGDEGTQSLEDFLSQIRAAIAQKN